MENSAEKQTQKEIESLDLEKRQALKEKRSQLMNGENGMEFFRQASTFAKLLEQKYGNQVNKCELYHFLAYSGMIERPEFFDFDGDDSIASFIEKKWQEVFALKGDSKI